MGPDGETLFSGTKGFGLQKGASLGLQARRTHQIVNWYRDIAKGYGVKEVCFGDPVLGRQHGKLALNGTVWLLICVVAVELGIEPVPIRDSSMRVELLGRGFGTASKVKDKVAAVLLDKYGKSFDSHDEMDAWLFNRYHLAGGKT